jgi:AAA ATPase-like protein
MKEAPVVVKGTTMGVANQDGLETQTLQPVGDMAIFRNFSLDDFRETESWGILKSILAGNGGCFGIYGPRGSGKSWLMHRAITKVEGDGGVGLWFPCPGKYEASEFLSNLSDNLATCIERRAVRRRHILLSLKYTRNVAIAGTALLVVMALVFYGVRGITIQGKAGNVPGAYPAWIWICAGIAASLALLAGMAIVFLNSSRQGALLREATSLRERIKFSESVRVGTGLGVGLAKGVSASLNRSQERTLSERQIAITSLVFEFRSLAANAVSTLKKPLVICVDELDKLDDASQLKELIQDIKGIFEVTGTYFLVSISEEAASSLRAGMLKSGSRNELNSSFHSVIALQPMEPGDAEKLLTGRGYIQNTRLARALCILSGGNRREMIRIAGSCAIGAERHQVTLTEQSIIDVLAEESLALLEEIARDLPEMAHATADEDIKYRAWMALPRESFQSPEKFVKLGTSAIRDYWEPRWATEQWASVREPWRRLLIRLFVTAKVLPPGAYDHARPCLLDDLQAVLQLRDTLVMATRDSGVARLMLQASFGQDLSDRYRPATSMKR